MNIHIAPTPSLSYSCKGSPVVKVPGQGQTSGLTVRPDQGQGADTPVCSLHAGHNMILIVERSVVYQAYYSIALGLDYTTSNLALYGPPGAHILGSCNKLHRLHLTLCHYG